MLCSTIIPTVGRESLTRAVQSVLEQPLAAGELEVVIVNDTNRPLPPGDWQASPFVRQISTNQRGQCVARNTGAAVARGRYLHFLDDDDWLLPGGLAELAQLAQSHPQACWLYGGVRLVDSAGRALREFNAGLDGNAHAQLVAGVWLLPIASLIRAEAFFATDGFHPTLRIAEEIHLGRQLTGLGDVAHTPAVVACKLNGEGWRTASTSYHESPEMNRWSRDRVLAAPGAFGRLRGSAGTPYWRGRILHAYLAAAHWNWKRGQWSAGASRAAFAMLSLALAGPALLSQAYWQAVRDQHVPHSALKVLSVADARPL